MKILSSSPYATFNVKEWDSHTKNSKKNNQNTLFELQAIHFKNTKRYNLKKSFQNNIEKHKTIQLSFI